MVLTQEQVDGLSIHAQALRKELDVSLETWRKIVSGDYRLHVLDWKEHNDASNYAPKGASTYRVWLQTNSDPSDTDYKKMQELRNPFKWARATNTQTTTGAGHFIQSKEDKEKHGILGGGGDNMGDPLYSLTLSMAAHPEKAKQYKSNIYDESSDKTLALAFAEHHENYANLVGKIKQKVAEATARGTPGRTYIKIGNEKMIAFDANAKQLATTDEGYFANDVDRETYCKRLCENAHDSMWFPKHIKSDAQRAKYRAESELEYPHIDGTTISGTINVWCYFDPKNKYMKADRLALKARMDAGNLYSEHTDNHKLMLHQMLKFNQEKNCPAKHYVGVNVIDPFKQNKPIVYDDFSQPRIPQHSLV